MRSLLAGLAAGLLAAGPAAAQPAYPDRPVKVIVNSAPGGLTDVVGRLVLTRMSQAIGQPMVLENRAGAGGILGADAVAKAEPDGYTIGVVASAVTVGPQLMPTPPFDASKDYAPVALLMSTPLLLVTNVNSPYASVAQLVADARARPGVISIASGGNATMTHLLAEQFQAEAGIRLIHVPYRGGAPALNDVLAGHVPVYFDTLNTSVKLVQDSKLRALAIVSPARSPALPAVPTLAEAGYPGVEGMAWYAIVAPARTPPAVVARLNQEANKALALPEIREQLVALGGTMEGGAPDVLARRLGSETARWGKLIRERGITAQ